VLQRLAGKDSLAQISENDLQRRYNENELPLAFYKKGSIKIAEEYRNNGIVEDFRTFRPQLFDNVKYARFYVSELGNVVGKHTAGLVRNPQDSSLFMWEFKRGRDQFLVPATDTNYIGFQALFSLPDSSLVPVAPVRMIDSTMERQLRVVPASEISDSTNTEAIKMD